MRSDGRVKFRNWVADSWAGQLARKYNLVNLDWYKRNGYNGIYGKLIEGSGYATRSITPETALTCSAVFACANVISQDEASLPLMVYERTADGKFPTRPTGTSMTAEQRLYELLHDQPNEEQSAMEFRQSLTFQMLIWGAGYAHKVRRRSDKELIALWPLVSKDVREDRDSQGRLVFIHKEGNAASKTYQPDEIFHLRGLTLDGKSGVSVINYARQAIDYALAAQEYGTRFLGQGGRPMGVLTHPGLLDIEGEEKLRERFAQVHGGLENSHKLLVLEEGMKFEPLGQQAKEMQLLELRQHQVIEVCRYFRMPPHKIQDLTRATFSNIEHQQLSYYTDTLRPHLVNWEQAIRRQLLTPEQRTRLFAEHKIEGLLRGDFESQMKGIALAVQNGLYSINEGRDLSNLNKVEGGDKHRVQAQMIDINETSGETPEEAS